MAVAPGATAMILFDRNGGKVYFTARFGNGRIPVKPFGQDIALLRTGNSHNAHARIGKRFFISSSK